MSETHEMVSVVGPETMVVDNELTLVSLKSTDAYEGYKIHDANRAFLAQHLDFAQSYTADKVVKDYKNAESRIASGELINYWIMKDGGKVGSIGMTFFEDNTAELGFWIIEPAQRQGIATRAAERLKTYGFKERGLAAIELHIKGTNTPSQNVAIRLGAHNTGEQITVESEGGSSIFEIWEVTNDER